MWRWAIDRPLRQVVTGIGLFLLLLTAPFGGWAKAPATATGPERFAVGKPMTLGPLELTVDRASWNTDPSNTFGPSKVGAYLLVIGHLRNSSNAMVPVGVMKDHLRLTGLTNVLASMDVTDPKENPVPPDKADYTLYNAPDTTVLSSVAPGLTYEVAYVFEVKGTTLPDRVTVDTFGYTWRKSSLDQTEMWLDRTPVGTVTVPLHEGVKHSHAPTSTP